MKIYQDAFSYLEKYICDLSIFNYARSSSSFVFI